MKAVFIKLFILAITGCAATPPVEEHKELAAGLRVFSDNDQELDIVMEALAEKFREAQLGEVGPGFELTFTIRDIRYDATSNELIYEFVTENPYISTITPIHTQREICGDPVGLAIINNSNVKIVYLIFYKNVKEGKIEVTDC